MAWDEKRYAKERGLVKLGVRVPIGMFLAVDQEAKRLGLKRADFVQLALASMLPGDVATQSQAQQDHGSGAVGEPPDALKRKPG